jgi:hypothetical protein
MAKRDFADHILPDDPDELARNLDIAERAGLWISALRAYAQEQIQRQVRVPGWELVPTRPTRKWIDDETTTAAAMSTLGLGPDTIYETRLRSPAQIEKMTRPGKFVRVGTGPPVGHLSLASLIESKSSGVKLVRTHNPDAAKEFSDDADPN